MSQRTGKNYAVHGSFRQRDEYDYGPVPDGITYSVADLIERGQHIWSNGAHKVALSVEVRSATGMKSKTFYGESAWNEAARYIDDVEQKLRRLHIDGQREMSTIRGWG
jgi:hypothetical protein